MSLMAAGRCLMLFLFLGACRHASARSLGHPETSDQSFSAKSQSFLRDAVSYVRSHAFHRPLATELVADGKGVVKENQPDGASEAATPGVNWRDILTNNLPEQSPDPEGADANYPHFYNALHDVVGQDGVLMITLEPEAGATKQALRSSSRRNATHRVLSEAGIIATAFPATDAHAAAAEDLNLGCYKKGHADTHNHCSGSVREPDASKHIQMGDGCASSVEQAIADSHRRALISARFREDEWTAIIEDDVMPFSASSEWGEAFKKAWAHMPPEAKFVRLGWCTFGEDVGPINQHISYDDGTFRIIDYMSLQNNWYYTGGCTTGYIVHKSIIPDLLGIFPCCSPIDSCLEQEFFYSPPFCRKDMSCLGRDIMVSLDAVGSTSYAFGRTMLKQQAGVIIQDNSRIKSFRPKFNQAG